MKLINGHIPVNKLLKSYRYLYFADNPKSWKKILMRENSSFGVFFLELSQMAGRKSQGFLQILSKSESMKVFTLSFSESTVRDLGRIRILTKTSESFHFPFKILSASYLMIFMLLTVTLSRKLCL
jgi:hypothetical protein